MKDFIKTNPMDFSMKKNSHGEMEISLGSMDWWDINKIKKDPNRRVHRGVKPSNKAMKRLKTKEEKKEARKSLFDLFKQKKKAPNVDSREQFKAMSNNKSKGLKNEEERLKGLFENYNIFDYSSKKREEEKRLERELEEEVERIERIERRKKSKDEQKKLREEEKKKKREEKKRKKKEKKRKALEKKYKKNVDKEEQFNRNILGNGDVKEKPKPKKKKLFISNREEDVFKEMKLAMGAPKKVKISEPKEFKRIGRVQIDSKKGFIFQNMKSDMKKLFEEHGISPELLHEEKQATRLYNKLLKRDKDWEKFVNFDQKKDVKKEKEKEVEKERQKNDEKLLEETKIKLDDLSTKELKKILVEVKNILSLRGAIADEEERIECIVCYESYREMLFHPCNHILLCEACSEESKMEICPFCREKIESTKKVFF